MVSTWLSLKSWITCKDLVALVLSKVRRLRIFEGSLDSSIKEPLIINGSIYMLVQYLFDRGLKIHIPANTKHLYNVIKCRLNICRHGPTLYSVVQMFCVYWPDLFLSSQWHGYHKKSETMR